MTANNSTVSTRRTRRANQFEQGTALGNELQLISDGEGLTVIGARSDVERFLASPGLAEAPSKSLDLLGLGSLLGLGGAAAQVGAELSANSGRWIKLTAESAEAVKEFGLMATRTPGVSHAMIGQPGDIQQWLQVAQGPATLLSSPLLLANLATIMQQQALQRQMEAISEYLTVIDEKVDDILRAQNDAVLADMIGVDLVIEDALIVRDEVGRVSEVTWSKVQATSMVLARTQGYALRQLDAIAEKLEKQSDLGDIAQATRLADPKVREWLAVLARSVQLQEGSSILELDRVMDSAPDELDRHRLGLRAARQNRLDLITRSTHRLLQRMDAAVEMANAKVLLNPFDSPAVVRSSNRVSAGVLDFRDRLGIESGQEATDAKRWRQAAGEMRDKIVASGIEGASAAKRFGDVTVDRATEAFREVDIDGDGIPDRPRAAVAAEEANEALKNATAGVAGAFGTLFQRKKERPATDESTNDGDTEPQSTT